MHDRLPDGNIRELRFIQSTNGRERGQTFSKNSNGTVRETVDLLSDDDSETSETMGDAEHGNLVPGAHNLRVNASHSTGLLGGLPPNAIRETTPEIIEISSEDETPAPKHTDKTLAVAEMRTEEPLTRISVQSRHIGCLDRGEIVNATVSTTESVSRHFNAGV